MAVSLQFLSANSLEGLELKAQPSDSDSDFFISYTATTGIAKTCLVWFYGWHAVKGGVWGCVCLCTQVTRGVVKVSGLFTCTSQSFTKHGFDLHRLPVFFHSQIFLQSYGHEREKKYLLIQMMQSVTQV